MWENRSFDILKDTVKDQPKIIWNPSETMEKYVQYIILVDNFKTGWALFKHSRVKRNHRIFLTFLCLVNSDLIINWENFLLSGTLYLAHLFSVILMLISLSPTSVLNANTALFLLFHNIRTQLSALWRKDWILPELYAFEIFISFLAFGPKWQNSVLLNPFLRILSSVQYLCLLNTGIRVDYHLVFISGFVCLHSLREYWNIKESHGMLSPLPSLFFRLIEKNVHGIKVANIENNKIRSGRTWPTYCIWMSSA